MKICGIIYSILAFIKKMVLEKTEKKNDLKK